MNAGLELHDAKRVLLWRSIDRDVFIIGSNPDCDVSVPLQEIAPVLCVLRLSDEQLTLENKAEGGTLVNEKPVERFRVLTHGDEITIGELKARVCLVEEAGNTRTLSSPGNTRGNTPSLQLVAGGNGSWILGSGGLSVGSDTGNDVVIDDPYVSAFHAQFFLQGERCIIRDLGSRNGCFINEKLIREGEVSVGASVRLGGTELKLEPLLEDGVQGMPLLGSSAAMEQVRRYIERVARANAPVLITGETGTGKEIVAQQIHEQSPRGSEPYVALNCGTLSKTLIESELFGHERGAFTDASSRKLGAFELAHKGTLFLDEIGELPLDSQPQFLRALESGEIRRLGAESSRIVDVRLVAATNRKLEEQVSLGVFREDLFHRLHVLAIDLPPLRHRREDLDELVEHFARLFSPNGIPVELTEAARKRLREHDWPGNVRELRNVLQRSIIMGPGNLLDEQDVLFAPSSRDTRTQIREIRSGRTLAEVMREAIEVELVRHKGSRSEAAQALGVSRSTIHRKIEEYGIDVDELTKLG